MKVLLTLPGPKNALFIVDFRSTDGYRKSRGSAAIVAAFARYHAPGRFAVSRFSKKKKKKS